MNILSGAVLMEQESLLLQFHKEYLNYDVAWHYDTISWKYLLSLSQTKPIFNISRLPTKFIHVLHM